VMKDGMVVASHAGSELPKELFAKQVLTILRSRSRFKRDHIRYTEISSQELINVFMINEIISKKPPIAQ